MNQADDQEHYLFEALSNVKQRAYQMERSLEERRLLDAINHASDMLQEMKTSVLSPKAYYELYIAVTDKLRLLELYLIEEHKNGRKVWFLYETVQYVASIIPRLYLLITVGIYYIKCSELSRREILRDLVEMCCGVQHPTRGLFLRTYLLHSLRADLLPDIEESALQHVRLELDTNTKSNSENTQAESCFIVNSTNPVNSQGTVTDSVNFLLLNFAEMNKLWVRMQHQGHTRDRERREQERRELRILVGTNLNRLSQLETIDVQRYKTQVLPPILEQIIECRDVIAQEYLTDVIIQVFPDEFHMATLPLLLQTLNYLQPGVKPRPIICSLINRLSQYATSELEAGREMKITVSVKPATAQTLVESNGCRSSNLDSENSTEKSNSEHVEVVDLFFLFFNEINQLIHNRLTLCELACGGNLNLANMKPHHVLVNAALSSGLPLEDIPTLYSALVYLAMLLHPENCCTLIDDCLNATADSLNHLGLKLIPPGSPLSRDILGLLYLPIGGSAPQSGLGVNRPSAPHKALTELHTILGMSGFRRLVALLDPKTTKCRLAYDLLSGTIEREQKQRLMTEQNQTSQDSIDSLVYHSARLTTESDLDNLFELIDCLLEADPNSCEDLDEFTEAQSLVAGMIHLLGPYPRSRDPDMCFKLLVKTERRLSQACSAVVRFNFPALVFEALQLALTYFELPSRDTQWNDNVKQIFQFCHQCCTTLVRDNSVELALRLFLQSSLIMDKIPFDDQKSMTYEFISQALTLYEEGVSDSRAQVEAMALITSTLCQIRCFTGDNLITLRSQCTRASAHLLRKHDQCRAVAATAHLYWPTNPMSRHNVKYSDPIIVTGSHLKDPIATEGTQFAPTELSDAELAKIRDGKGVLTCLNRAAQFARECIDSSVKAQLFIGLLDSAVKFRLANCKEITDDLITEYVVEIRKLLKGLDHLQLTDHIVTHFENSLNFIRFHQSLKSDSTDLGDDMNTLSDRLFEQVQL